MGSANCRFKTHKQNTRVDGVNDEIRIVLVGKSGVGKSALGNSLLGGLVFNVDNRMSSVTSICSRKHKYVESIKSTITLIDTPGLFDTKTSNDESTKAIVESINLTHPGPHVFIIVVNLATRFTAEHQDTVNYIENIFGEKYRKFMIVVFTNKQQSDVEIDDTWVRHVDQEPLKSLLEKCKYRYRSIDNKGEKVEEDVKSILQLIKQTIKDNDNHHYTGEHLKENNERSIKEETEKTKTETLQGEAKENKPKEKTTEDAENIPSTSYDLQHSSNVGIPDLVDESSGSEVTDDGTTGKTGNKSEEKNEKEKKRKEEKGDVRTGRAENKIEENNEEDNNTAENNEEEKNGDGTKRNDEIRIVLVGKTGVGKSECGNSLLDDIFFEVGSNMSSVTSICSRKHKYVESIKSTIRIIDTPGLFDTKKSNDESTKAIVKCIELTRPGPHVFIVVVNLVTRFTAEDQAAIDYIENIFGKKYHQFMIVVFTNKQHSGVEIDDEWVRHSDQEPLKSLLEKCNYRYSSIDNKGEKVEEDVKSILQLIKQTIKDNNNQYYTGEMYDEAATLYMALLKEKEENERLVEEIKQLRPTADVETVQLVLFDVERIPRGFFKDSTGIPSCTLRGKSFTDKIQLKSYVFHAKSSKVTEPKRVRGKMPDEDYKKIQTNFTMLVANIQPDVLCQALFEKEVFDEDDLDLIKAEESKGKKAVNDKLLRLLLHCGPEAFDKFMTSLHQTGHDGILKQFQSGDGRTGKTGNKTEENNEEENNEEGNNEEEKNTEETNEEENNEEEKKTEEKNEKEKRRTEAKGRTGKAGNKREDKKEAEENKTEHNKTDGNKKEESNEEETKLNEETYNKYSSLQDSVSNKQNKSELRSRSQHLIPNANGDGINCKDFADVSQVDTEGNTVLHCIVKCEHGDIIPCIERIINTGKININRKNYRSETPLMLACKFGLTSVIKWLLDYRADVGKFDKEGNTVLHYIVKSKHNDIIQCIERIINTGKINTNRKNNRSETPLMLAYEFGLASVINLLLNHGADVNLVDESKNTVLHYIVKSKHNDIIPCIERIINTGKININRKNSKDETPIILACRFGMKTVIDLLLDHGADVSQFDKEGNTILHYIVKNKHDDFIQCIERIIKKGININAKNKYEEKTPLILACELGMTPVINLLLDRKAEVNQFDNAGNTFLHYIVKHTQADISPCIKKIIKTKININIQTERTKQTPIMLACEFGLITVINTLFNNGAGVSQVNCYGNTVLHYIVKHQHADIIRRIERIINTGKIDITRKNNRGETPIMVACEFGLTSVINLLLDTGAHVGQLDKDCNPLLAGVNRVDYHGNTVLHYIVKNDHENIIRCIERIINTGINNNRKNKIGKTPLNIASELGKTSIVQLLSDHGAFKY